MTKDDGRYSRPLRAVIYHERYGRTADVRSTSPLQQACIDVFSHRRRGSCRSLLASSRGLLVETVVTLFAHENKADVVRRVAARARILRRYRGAARRCNDEQTPVPDFADRLSLSHREPGRSCRPENGNTLSSLCRAESQLSSAARCVATSSLLMQAPLTGRPESCSPPLSLSLFPTFRRRMRWFHLPLSPPSDLPGRFNPLLKVGTSAEKRSLFSPGFPLVFGCLERDEFRARAGEKRSLLSPLNRCH